MKRGGVLSPALSHLLASTGHSDYFTICDRGFPVPEGPERIDLALVDDIPTVVDVLAAVIAEWSVDRILITHEMDAISRDRVAEMQALLGDVPFERVSHGQLKRLAQTARATVRTGDTVSYANIIVVSG
jgi:D-ribose pyranase